MVNAEAPTVVDGRVAGRLTTAAIKVTIRPPVDLQVEFRSARPPMYQDGPYGCMENAWASKGLRCYDFGAYADTRVALGPFGSLMVTQCGYSIKGPSKVPTAAASI